MAGGTLWNAVATLISTGSVFLAHLLLANLLGRTVFGQFSIVISTINTVAGTSQLAMPSTATKYVAEFRNSDPYKAAHVARLASRVTRWAGIATAILLFMLAPVVADDFFRVTEIKTSLMLASISTIFVVWSSAATGILAGLESFRRIAVANLPPAVAYLLLVPLLGLALGVQGAVAGLAIAAISRWALLERAARKSAKSAGLRPDVASRSMTDFEKRVFTRFALPAALSGSSTLPALWLANGILARQVDGVGELALANAAFAIRNLVVLIPGMFTSVVTAVMNNARGENQERGVRQTFLASLFATMIIVLPLAAGIGAASNWAMSLYGESFQAGSRVLQIMMWAAVFEGVAIAAYQVIQSHGIMWQSFLTITLPRDCLIVVLTLYFAPTTGAVGFATAYMIAWAAACLMILFTSYKLQPELFLRRRTPK